VFLIQIFLLFRNQNGKVRTNIIETQIIIITTTECYHLTTTTTTTECGQSDCQMVEKKEEFDNS
jgi:hypothetical protein